MFEVIKRNESVETEKLESRIMKEIFGADA